MLTIISLGAGVQSTAMALMAAHGEITPMPDCAIFADTGWEPRAVYDHLDWLCSSNVLPFPVRRVSNGNIREDVMRNVAGETAGKRSATPPFFTLGSDGREAMLHRQCTSAYKVEPINRELRRLLGAEKGRRLPAGASAEVWIGISTDEAHRAKPAAERWIRRRWPLLDAGMSRWDCLRWIERHDYPMPPKSACIGCPYRDEARWRDMKNSPDEWADAVAFDEAIRDGLRGTDGPLYLHRSLKPLAEVDLRTHAERGQADLFGNECEGMCGT